jgi:hypothetical protein
VSKFRELHNAAMNDAQKSLMLRLAGNDDAARQIFLRAAESERAAFELLVEPPASEPTWTIIAISVASLYYKAGDCEKAAAYALQVINNPAARPSSYYLREAEGIIASCQDEVQP